MSISADLPTLALWAGAMAATGALAGIIAGLLGVGGGIVIVPALFHFMTALEVDAAVRMHVAVGTSLAIIVPTSLRSARAHFRREAVDTRLLRAWAPWLAAGVLLGSVLAGYVSGGLLSVVFAAVALLVACDMTLRSDGRALCAGSLPTGPGRVGLAGSVGTISTMMGIGGGTLCVPILSAFGYPVRRAVGTSAAIGVIIAVPGTVGFLVSGLGAPARPPLSLGYVNLLGLALVFPVSVLLAPLGARLAHTIPPRALRYAFAAFLAVTSLRMLYDVS